MITFEEGKQIFKLDTQNTTYMMGLVDDVFLGHIYYGKKLRSAGGSYRFRTDEYPMSPRYLLREKLGFFGGFPFEYPTGGVGDYSESCLDITNEVGQNGCELHYVSHHIEKGKPRLPGLPASFGSEQDVETLFIVLQDELLKVQVELQYSVFEAEDVITRCVTIRNGSEHTYRLEKAYSACLHVEKEKDMELITLAGAWARERHMDRRPVGHGKTGVSTVRGETSHQEHAFLGLVSPETTQTVGEVYGMQLVYSGNYSAQVEKNLYDIYRLTMGINGETFSWKLNAGDVFVTPEAILTYSDQGLGQMSRNYHDFMRNHLIRSPYLHKDRPILINNWEATYFDFNTEKLLDLAREAKKQGIEMLVMDDGWFGKRNFDDSSLGDWVVNEEKLQGGLKYLVDQVNAIGLKFGIWFEPEMVSPDSDLYRAHPDWAIQLKDRPVNMHRAQYVLDITREDVRDYVYGSIAKILRSANIEYVKWDMNRAISDAGSCMLPADQQGEVFHRYVLGLYDLLERLTTEFPNLLLEHCSGGGGRFDAGMLYYGPQIWTSDDTDAVERLRIQEGTALLYPLSTMGAHVSKCPNEQVGRMTSMKMRGDVALSGTFGYELDLTTMPEEEKALIPAQVENYHKYHSLISDGDYYRLHSWDSHAPYDAWMVVSKDKSEALVTFCQVLGRPGYKRILLPLQGLDASAEYILDGEDAVLKNGETVSYEGDLLMELGLLIGNSGDFSSRLYHFRRK
ncbi:MAG: alpha-galactosidase [Lachnospiraceae bacterium]|nr:alpha-galactosidase [Lachnospiraceae bacterium]